MRPLKEINAVSLQYIYLAYAGKIRNPASLVMVNISHGEILEILQADQVSKLAVLSLPMH